MSADHDHVLLIVEAPDGEIDVRYSRHPVDIDDNATAIWAYHVAALAEALPDHKLRALVDDENHAHPGVLTSTGYRRRDNHMP